MRTSYTPGPSFLTMTQNAGRKIAAERTRFMEDPRWRSGGDLAGRQADGLRIGAHDPAVAALALLIIDDGLQELSLAEVRPERLGHPDLGVGDLPEQEVADAQLTGGANQQV